MRERRLALVALVWTLLVACSRVMHDESMSVASVSLTCLPAAVGVRCQLLVLSREASEPPRNVTAWASWRAGTNADLRLLRGADVIDVTGDGDVTIETEFASKRAHTAIRVAPKQPGQILGALRGSIHVYKSGGLDFVTGARVEVTSGSGVRTQTVSASDGTYEFPVLTPGPLTIHVTKAGFLSAELAVTIRPGDNRVNPVMDIEPSDGHSAL